MQDSYFLEDGEYLGLYTSIKYNKKAVVDVFPAYHRNTVAFSVSSFNTLCRFSDNLILVLSFSPLLIS